MKRKITPEDLLRFVSVSDPQISPDGDRIAFTHRVTETNKPVMRIAITDLAGESRFWTQTGNRDSSPRWSPDGSHIAFLSDRTGESQLYLLPMAGGEAEVLTSLPEGTFGGFKWSPDGRWIAATFRERSLERTKKAGEERAKENGSDLPWVLEDIQYRLDGDGYYGADRYRLLLIDAKTGKADALVQDAPDGGYSFGWSPDSAKLVVAHTGQARPYFDPPHDVLRVVDLEGNSTFLEGLPVGEKSNPAWSEDGGWIAYLGSTYQDDPWHTRNTRAFVCRADGSEAKCLTPGQDLDLSVATLTDAGDFSGGSLYWLGGRLLAQAGWHGGSHPVAIGLDGSVEFLTSGNFAVALGGPPSLDGKLAVVTGDPTRLPEIAVLAGKELRSLTSFNAALLEELELIAPEEIWLDSTPKKDGSPSRLHAWVIRPSGEKPGPAAIEVHGGPHTQYGWTFFHEFQVLAASGYTVVYSNPRGSKGYGEDFCNAIYRDWGNKDWEDVETLTRWVAADPGVDPDRIAMMGGSYGGYMTNWAVGHSSAYRTAVTDRCVSNLVSMSGSSDFPFNRDGYFMGTAYGSLEDIRELWRQSPLAYFDGVKTPMLIIHSEGDLRCNVEQGEQVFTALQEQGVRSKFVRYPKSTSHGMSRNGPSDLRIHRLHQILDWYRETL